jgi:DNA-binding CsgD family transcriptional regulator/MFS family permease
MNTIEPFYDNGACRMTCGKQIDTLAADAADMADVDIANADAANTAAPSARSGAGGLGGTSRLYVTLSLALTLGFLGYWLLNHCVFPLFDTVFIWAREVSAGTGGLTLMAVALVAAWKPSAFKGVPIVSATLSAILGSAVLMVCGLYFNSIPLLLVGAWLSTVANGVVTVIAGLSCTRMGLRGAGISIAAAYLAAYALRWLFIGLPGSIGLCTYILAPVVALALVVPSARPLLERVVTAQPPAQKAVTQPASFLPFGNRVFICLILFRFVYGYVLTFGETERVPFLTALTIIPLAALLVVVVLKKNELDADRLFLVAVLCVVAGFLALLVQGKGNNPVIAALLASGVGFFEILLLFILIALGSKNQGISLVILSWASALNSLATLVGANFGRFTDQYYESSPLVASSLVAGVVLVFVAYILVALKGFSFKHTVESIEGSEPGASIVVHSDTPQIQDACDVLGRRYELTAREHEVLHLLARGRSSKVIQEELNVSYNTVKAHVRHIYTKLNVHGQQELIDMVEDARAGEARRDGA